MIAEASTNSRSDQSSSTISRYGDRDVGGAVVGGELMP